MSPPEYILNCIKAIEAKYSGLIETDSTIIVSEDKIAWRTIK